MPRLSITLTERQNEALERIAAETGATKQSMIGLAVSAWIRHNDYLPNEEKKTPENAPEEPEQHFTVVRDGIEVAWLRGRWESDEHKAIIATAHRISSNGAMQEVGRKFRYVLVEGDRVE